MEFFDTIKKIIQERLQPAVSAESKDLGNPKSPRSLPVRFFRYLVIGSLGILSAYFAMVYATAVTVLPFVVVWNALSPTARVWILVVVPILLVIAGGAILFIKGIAVAVWERFFLSNNNSTHGFR